MKSYSENDLIDFINEWGQTTQEICDELGFENNDGISDIIMVDHFWYAQYERWLPKSSALYSDSDQEFAELLRFEKDFYSETNKHKTLSNQRVLVLTNLECPYEIDDYYDQLISVEALTAKYGDGNFEILTVREYIERNNENECNGDEWYADIYLVSDEIYQQELKDNEIS